MVSSVFNDKREVKNFDTIMLKKNEGKIKFAKIIRLIKRDAQKGLELFYNEYGKRIYLTAKYMGCSDEKAKIVVNTVLIKIWQKIDKIKGIENPMAWISAVAKNCAKDELNEPWHLELKEEICEAKDDFQKIIDKDGFEYLLIPLKDEEKDLFILKFIVGCTFQDIADGFEKPLPTVTTIFYRALEKIKKFLKEENYE